MCTALFYGTFLCTLAKRDIFLITNRYRMNKNIYTATIPAGYSNICGGCSFMMSVSFMRMHR